MKHISFDDIEQMEQRVRARLINSLSGFKSANLVATVSEDGHNNLAIISSCFHLGASPALMGMVIRPDSVPRDTLSNIEQMGCYTINHVSADIYRQAHQTSARYAAEVSEFDKVGLSAEFVDGIEAPFVAQSQLKFSLELREVLPLAINGTTLVIGEITSIFVADSALKADGYVDIEALASVAVSGLDSYHQTRRLARLSYAKPDKALVTLPVDGH
ncbi:flavin reductase family protein [Shewanella fidelis]|uniref:Flavin reductase n=1 Tax=Shewanella fidelis TaxID=173509 RepID=A0AAW8NIK3_9GAMM|nr:flavin reductase [Shewanella fidelis]MDR8522697.1 flavin reductase [Shewanella fidelis]MDW4812312.1 flavin reductase [Shewanella fidelis]MDW4816023.1 flavin reductase [Shewanella fidelis]MDW4820553.1 flavin reductase [Shewanella fidelis]MDW4824776.1 flavin reductase [Shewanella fidelis]